MIKTWISKLLNRCVNAVVRRRRSGKAELPADFTPWHRQVVQATRCFTLTSPERIHALVEAVRYIIANDVPGALVECGVYKGGSMMAVAMTLLKESITERDLYLYDTFEGMPKPDTLDIDIWGRSAAETFKDKKLTDTSSNWINCPIDEVKRAMNLTGYPSKRIHYFKGLVEETLPDNAPKNIALLRLDTDWYSSTKHELIHLYPRVVRNGVVIIDDYGHYRGAQKAVDEFFLSRHEAPYLHRIDYTGRLIIKSN